MGSDHANARGYLKRAFLFPLLTIMFICNSDMMTQDVSVEAFIIQDVFWGFLLVRCTVYSAQNKRDPTKSRQQKCNFLRVTLFTGNFFFHAYVLLVLGGLFLFLISEIYGFPGLVLGTCPQNAKKTRWTHTWGQNHLQRRPANRRKDKALLLVHLRHPVVNIYIFLFR